jgi:hypothetical protein
MKRAQYEKMGNPLALAPDLKNVPWKRTKRKMPWKPPGPAGEQYAP